MTSLKTDAKASMNGHGAPPVARVGAPLPLRQKRPGYAALAIVLIVGLAAVGAYFYSQAGKKVPVVVVVTDVPAGHKIQRASWGRCVSVEGRDRHVDLVDGRGCLDDGVRPAAAMRVEIENEDGVRSRIECRQRGES